MGAVAFASKQSMRTAPLFSDSASTHLLERVHHVVRRGCFDAHRRIAPPRAVSPQDAARPFVSDVQPAGDPDAIVGHEQFPVIARHDTEPPTEAKWIEDRELHTASDQLSPKRARRSSNADPI